jgi:8-oxo-dGTP diphosphatase
MDDDAGLRAQVRAAGGVLCREGGAGAVEVAVVHRPRYDDWSLPKGKLDPGEEWEEAARREVEEETGLTGRLEEELSPIAYQDQRGRDKIVRYWRMSVSGGEFAPNDEVDELRWLDVDAAAAILTYPADRELVREASEWVRAAPG